MKPQIKGMAGHLCFLQCIGILAVFLSAMPISYAALTDGLIGSYSLDANFSGTVKDNLNAVNLTLFGSANPFTTGKILGSYNKTGVVGNRASNTKLATIGNDFSMTAWFNPTDLPIGTSGTSCWPNTNGRTIALHEDGTSKITYGLLHAKLDDGNQYVMMVRNKDGVATNCLYYRLSLNTSQWYFISGTYSGNNLTLYLDNIQINSSTAFSGNGTGSTGNQMTIGAGTGGGDTSTSGFNGAIDEVNVWNRALSTSELSQLYASGTGIAWPFVGGVTETLSLNAILRSYNGTIYNTISTNDDFQLTLNYTNQTSPKLNANCSVTFNNNISYHLENRTFTRFNLTDTAITRTLITNEGSGGAYRDLYYFRACRVGSGVNAQIYLNNTLYRTIDSSIIPVCAGDEVYHEEINTTTTTILNRSINYSIRCSGLCGSGGRYLSLIPDQDGGTMHYEREFSSHNESSFVYNATRQTYDYANFYRSKISSINMTLRCNTTVVPYTKDVSIANISIRVLDINDVIFTNGMQIESNDTTNITFDVSGSIINYISTNVTYSNGTLIKNTVDNEYITLTKAQLNKNGIYNISIYALTENGYSVVNNSYFLLNDTIFPRILFMNPTNGSTKYLDETFTSDIRCEDVNLYGYEMISYDPSGNINQQFNATGISGYQYIIAQNIIINKTGLWQIWVSCVDSHTDKEFKKMTTESTKDSLTFYYTTKVNKKTNFGNITIKSMDSDISSSKEIYSRDRYNFEFNYTKKKSKGIYELKMPGAEYLPDSSYPGHFVSMSSMMWADFNDTEVDYASVVQTDIDTYRIDVTFKKPVDSIIFKSIGGLNVNNESVYFNVEEDPSQSTILDFGVCPESIEGQMSLWFAFIILAAFFLLGLWIHFYLISMLSCIAGIFYFVVYLGCNQLIGSIGIAISILLMFWIAMYILSEAARGWT